MRHPARGGSPLAAVTPVPNQIDLLFADTPSQARAASRPIRAIQTDRDPPGHWRSARRGGSNLSPSRRPQMAFAVIALTPFTFR